MTEDRGSEPDALGPSSGTEALVPPSARRESADAARKEAEALRADREKAAKAAEREAARARRDQEKSQRARDKDAQNARRAAERLQAERERAVRDAEREAVRAHREAEKAALDARLARQRAERQVDKALLEAARAGLTDQPDGDLPADLEILWRRAEPGRRGPRPGLTLDGIAEAAIALADAEGLASVSMARVAETLGVTTMALYRYVGSKDDLLALMYDLAIGPPPELVETPAPPPDTAAAALGTSTPAPVPGWRRTLEHWSREQLAVAREHPWVMQNGVLPRLGPYRVAWIERGLAAFEGTTLPQGLRVYIMGIVALHVLSEGQVIAGAALRERGAQDAPHAALLDYGTLLRRVTNAEDHPSITAALGAGAFDDDADGGDAVGLGLDLLLDGVQALVERETAATPTPRIADAP